MGTISDKLMRIINTKEDIRQALISKGYDVPTSIPFKEYAKMISDLPCRVDSFPDIEGIVARYSALGLTNEQMAANPVWVDKTGNGHDLQMKNFLWDGMSGVGGYETNAEIYEFSPTSKNKIVADRVKHISFTFEVKGMVSGNDLSLRDGLNTIYYSWKKDGIYTVDIDVLDPAGTLRLYNGYSHQKGTFTVRIFPSYPGALVFDGVDDYGICENFPILTKEKGYTVVALRSYLAESIGYLVYNGTSAKQSAFAFERSDSLDTWSWGKNSSIRNLLPKLMSYQTSNSYNNNIISTGTAIEGDKLIRIASVGGYSNVAIWELVFLDHDATEEELTKIKDYFVKTYPWLFPDQAWTVTGKTNEDEDRATIANITGNGNDLVLSNFGFAEGSGYGLYAYNFNSFNLKDNVVKSTDVKKDSFRMIGTGNSSNVLILLNESDSADWKIRITGMKEGDRCLIGNANKSGEYISVNKDGTYTFQKQYAATSTNGIWYNSSQEVDVLVEQIPEYEGYLITDGVDDIASSNTIIYEADFTFIGEWKFIQKDDTVAGINSSSHLYIQNRYNRGATVMINSAFENKKNITDYMTFKAITSKGKAYDENWNEVDLLYGDGNKGPSGVNIGGQGGTEFCHMIFKNMALYMNKVFSKDDCIKAYNYLQTLKAK